MSSVDHLCEELKSRGRRVTPQRRAIIEALLADHSHLTAEQVFARVSERMPDMSPTTVYNTLHELVEMGLLTELDLGLRGRYYDIVTRGHAHLVCLGCGQIEDVPYDCAALSQVAEHVDGFRVISCSIIFHGHCAGCVPPKEA